MWGVFNQMSIKLHFNSNCSSTTGVAKGWVARMEDYVVGFEPTTA